MIRKSTFETAICDLYVYSYMAGIRGSVEQWNSARVSRTKLFAMLDDLFEDIEKLTEERDDWRREAEMNRKED